MAFFLNQIGLDFDNLINADDMIFNRVIKVENIAKYIAKYSSKKQKYKMWSLNFLIGNLRAYGGCLD